MSYGLRTHQLVLACAAVLTVLKTMILLALSSKR
nr:MAG TPA: hypothetical protein [Caudoviricetes sp.]